jgi:hypothetical protein
MNENRLAAGGFLIWIVARCAEAVATARRVIRSGSAFYPLRLSIRLAVGTVRALTLHTMRGGWIHVGFEQHGHGE